MKMSTLESRIKNNSISYLLSIENITNNKILNSYFVEKCAKLAQLDGVGLPIKFKNTLSRCPKCLTERKKVISSYDLLPVHGNRTFIKKICRKTSLTKYQRKYMKRFQGCNENSLVITCQICYRKTQKKFEKPSKKNIVSDVDDEVKEIRKKKKKKDTFSGLSKDIIMKTSVELKSEKSFTESPKIKHNTALTKTLQDVKKQKDKMKKTLNKLKTISGQDRKKKGLMDFLNSISK